MNLDDFVGHLHSAQETSQTFVLVTVVDAAGSIPQNPGAKAIITGEGLKAGTIGGGRVEARAIKEAFNMLEGLCPPTMLTRWDLNRDLGMTCGGAISLFFERFSQKEWTIAIFGAGHVSQALVPLLKTMHCRVNVYDERTEWLDKLPQASNIRISDSKDHESIIADLDRRTFFVVMTKGHRTDLPIIKSILQKGEPTYSGVIGSDRKGQTLKKALTNFGISRQLAELVRCPIGLDIGTNKPSEIAISIAAQLIQVRDELQEELYGKS